MQKYIDRDSSMSTLGSISTSFEESNKTNSEFKDIESDEFKKLETKNKQLQYQLKIKEFKITQLQHEYLLLQKRLKQKQQYIEIYIDKIYKLKKKLKTQENKIKNTLLYIQQQIQYETSIREQAISYLKQQNQKLQMQLKNHHQQKQKQKVNSEESSYDQKQITNEIKKLQANMFNQYIWKLEEVFVKHFKDQNRLKSIIFPLFKSIFQENNEQETIITCFQDFLINLARYQKHIQQKDMIEEFITDFVAEIEEKNLVLDSEEDSWQISKSRNNE